MSGLDGLKCVSRSSGLGQGSSLRGIPSAATSSSHINIGDRAVDAERPGRKARAVLKNTAADELGGALHHAHATHPAHRVAAAAHRHRR